MTVSTCAVPKITGHAWRLPGATCDRGIEGQLYAPGPPKKVLFTQSSVRVRLRFLR